MVSISLQPESGYVFLVVAGTFILNFYQMIKVNIESFYSNKSTEEFVN